MSDQGALFVVDREAVQWRAEQMQLVNWGGFQGVQTIVFSPGATLIAGATGSGKSTVLDAYLALMMDSNTPFNGASNDATVGRARSKEQRSLLTYLRGKLDDITADGEDTARVMRGANKATWGAIAVTFVDGTGRRFTVVRLYHVPRSATSDSEIAKKLCTVDGAVDLHQFADLAVEKFDKKALERRYPKLTVHPSYTQFSVAVQTHLGIGAHGDGNNALRLLARIQAGKAMPTVDALFKTMVLESPPTYAAAESAAAHFADLEDSYTLMVTAERKRRALDGIVEAWEQRRQQLETLDAIAALQLERNADSPLAHWAATTESTLVAEANEATAAELEDATRRREGLLAEREICRGLLRNAEQAYQDAGGGAVEELERQIAELEEVIVAADRALAEFNDRTAVLGIVLQSADDLGAAQIAANLFVDTGYQEAVGSLSEERDRVNQFELWPQQGRTTELHEERASLEGRAGRVPPSWHEARLAAATALGVHHSELPFVAELLDVAASEHEWRDAAEVMLAPVARVLLVDDRLLNAFTTAIDGLTWKARLSYEGVELRHGDLRELDPAMLSGKLTFKEDSPFTWWVQKRVTSAKFDALCVDTPQELVGAERRVTRSGQTRKGRSGAHGRSNLPAILGFDNTTRLAEIAEELESLEVLVKAGTAKLKELDQRGRRLTKLRDAHVYVRDTLWDSIDPGSIRIRIDELSERRQRILGSDNRLAGLEQEVALEREKHDGAVLAEVLAKEEVAKLEKTQESLTQRAVELQLQLTELDERGRGHTPDQAEMLDSILDEVAGAAPYETDRFVEQLGQVTNVLRERRQSAADTVGSSETQLTRAFRSFQDQWPDPNLGTGVDSYPNYLEIFNSITASGLHEKREEWAHRVTSWTGEDLVPLHLAFDEAVEDIKERLAPINPILSTLAFGAHRDRLRIELRQLHHDDHARFRKQLKELSSGVLGHVPFDAVEERFEQMRKFIELIRPGSGTRGHSRDYYLDVHRHIELSAVAVDDSGEARAKYTSLGGKSGGETQELAAFIVGAALRYQLGDESRSVPRFAPVFLDEGFVKADSEFAGRSVQAWRGLGFQLVVATAFGTVSALEPHMDQLLQVTKNPTDGRARVHVLAAAPT